MKVVFTKAQVAAFEKYFGWRLGAIRKAHKYIRRWEGADGKFHYAYPQGWKGKRKRETAKRAIAAKTELITKIRPLEVHSEQDIADAIDAMIRRGGKKGFACHALGGRPVFVTKKTESHIKFSKGQRRTPEARNRKARYIPFIPELLEKGRISEKSWKREGLVYGIIGQVEYKRSDGAVVHECVELAVAYDKAKRQFVLSFSDIPLTVKKKSKKNIKKALPSGRVYGNFGACQIVDARTKAAVNLRYTATVPITAYSMPNPERKIKQKDENLFEKHINALLKTIGEL